MRSFVSLRPRPLASGVSSSRWAKDGFHILGQHVIATVQNRRGLGHRRHSQGGSGAGAAGDLAVLPGELDEGDDIVHHRVLEIDAADRLLHPQKLLPRHNPVDLLERIDPALAGEDHIPLVVGLGVADRQAHGEAVHLRVRQKLGAGGAGGVLGGDDDKGLGDGVRHAVHGNLALLHGLKQGGLGTRGGAVELVGQKQVAQNGAVLVLHLTGLLVVDAVAGDV